MSDMCLFIAFAIENTKKAALFFSKFECSKNLNTSFNERLPPKYSSFWLTLGECSCHFYSNVYNKEEEYQQLKKKFSASKYKKKGWSEKRIEKEIILIQNKSKKKRWIRLITFFIHKKLCTRYWFLFFLYSLVSP
jgi:hypothetical protein